MKVLRRRRHWPVILPGGPQEGWLPQGAAQPPPEPEGHVELDVRIEQTHEGYFVIASEEAGNRFFDTWHQSLEEAEAEAYREYGLGADDWDERL